MTPIWIDLIVVAILLGSVLIAAWRGAMRVLSGILGTVGGVIGAVALLDTVQPLVRGIIEPFVVRMVENAALASGIEQGVVVVSEAVRGFLQGLHLPEAAVDDLLARAESLGDAFFPTVQATLLDQIAPIVTFLLIFIVLKLAISLLCRLFDLRIPVLHTLNRMAGAVLGAVSGLLIVLVLSWGMVMFAPVESIGLLNQTMFAQSVTGTIALQLFG